MTPASSGYSGKPLVEKLGYKPEQVVHVLDAPAWFVTYLESCGVITAPELPASWQHAFFTDQQQLEVFLDTVNLDTMNGMWVSWPKKSSGVQTDITEQTFRDAILPLGWVDTKVCAIDQTWSGLKFVPRKT